MELEIASFSLREVVEQAASVVQFRAEEGGLQLVVQVQPDIPLHCLGDACRLKRVLLNLLSNGMPAHVCGRALVLVAPSRTVRTVLVRACACACLCVLACLSR